MVLVLALALGWVGMKHAARNLMSWIEKNGGLVLPDGRR
jgi:hypothetical protein